MKLFEYHPFIKRVLVVGTNELHIAGLLNYLYESGYDSIGALQNDEAIRFFKEHNPHIVIITQHVEAASREALKNFFLEINKNLTLFELVGGVSALKLLIEENNNV
jgi:AmiR/NasT family two-component response regulator